jgi:glucokinase-like ROK family protein
LLGVAVGVPGLVDQASGTLLFAPNLRWKDIPLRAILESAIHAPVFVDNEASLAALGEHYFGAAQNHKEVLYISAGVGLGGGVVHDGLLFSGVTGFGGEFGHMTMDPDGELCNCGNRGCWETQVSQRAIFNTIKTSIASGQTSLLLDLTHGDLEQLNIPLVVAAVQAGDPVARAALDKVGHYLGIGIACLVNALNPELIVFGGILSLASEFLLPLVEEELQRRALPWNRDATQLVVARHGADACMMGGVAKVYQEVLAEPGRIERSNIPATSVYADSSMLDLDRKEVRHQAQ